MRSRHLTGNRMASLSVPKGYPAGLTRLECVLRRRTRQSPDVDMR